MAAVTASVVDVRPPVIIHPRRKDIFSEFSLDNQLQKQYAQGIEALKKEARSMLMAAKSTKLMILIDTLERLGLAYHFEKEIEEKLQEIYEQEDGDYDLFTTALRFRLLRQHQRHVPCSVFDKFKNKEGKFDEDLVGDVEGLLSLYDAAYLQIHGENILEEALIFTTHHLTCIAPQLDDASPFTLKLKRALEYPLHREVPIIHVHVFISIYERDDTRDELLLKLAKLNFNFLQNTYKNELSQLSKWWNNIDMNSKLPYIRDCLPVSYLWAVGFHFEPQYSDVRIAVTKGIQILLVIDDTYDNYATLGEAQRFTQALERWNLDEMDSLGDDYLKIGYRFILGAYDEFEGVATKEQKFAIAYFKEELKKTARAYNQELKWVTERTSMPSFEEYAKNSEITSGIYYMLAAAFPFLKSKSKETIEWLVSQPRIAVSLSMLARFGNDLGSHQRESKGGKILTVVDCYMKQYGVSKQDTISKFRLESEDEWKNFNAAWIKDDTARFSKELVVMFLNIARLMDATYKHDEDAFTDPTRVVGPDIKALFVNPPYSI